MLGPVLIKYGSNEQKRYWLPRILEGSDWWCQGYSEPGAGSDLAGISFVLIDMKTPGVEVRPTILLDGEHEVNEVFFVRCVLRSRRWSGPYPERAR